MHELNLHREALYVMLHYVMLLCYVMSCHVALRYITLFYVMLLSYVISKLSEASKTLYKLEILVCICMYVAIRSSKINPCT